MKKLLSQWKKIVLGALVGALLGGLVGYVIFIKSTPLWEATSTLQVIDDVTSTVNTNDINNPITIGTVPPMVVVEMMRSRKFILDATTRAGHPELAHLLMDQRDGGEGMLRVKIIRNSPLIIVSVRAPSRENAQAGVEAVSSEILRVLWEEKKPLLSYVEKFIEKTEVMIDEDKKNYDLIAARIAKLKQDPEENYANLLLLQSQNAISRSQLLGRVLTVKMNYLAALSKSPKSILEASAGYQPASPNFGILLLLGSIMGLLIGAAISSLKVMVSLG